MSISIRILFCKCQCYFFQIFHSCRDFQAKIVQPVLSDEHHHCCTVVIKYLWDSIKLTIYLCRIQGAISTNCNIFFQLIGCISIICICNICNYTSLCIFHHVCTTYIHNIRISTGSNRSSTFGICLSAIHTVHQLQIESIFFIKIPPCVIFHAFPWCPAKIRIIGNSDIKRYWIIKSIIINRFCRYACGHSQCAGGTKTKCHCLFKPFFSFHPC